ncbi:MAG: 50S ribosomal protein L10 [Dehalococcoidia bacterium]
MATPRKAALIEDLKDRMGRASMAIGADYKGMTVQQMNAFRRALREADVELKVIKNTLALMAAEQAGRPEMASIISGTTIIAFGYDDPVQPAKALTDYIRQQRLRMTIHGGWMDGEVLDGAAVEAVAALPSREQLVANVVGKLQSPLYNFSGLIQSTIRNLAGLVEARAAQLEETAA